MPGQVVPPGVRVPRRHGQRPDRPTAAPAGASRGPRPTTVSRGGIGALLTEDLPSGADLVIVGAGIAGLAFARELVARGVRDIVIVDRGYPGGGATGRNVARIRAMQLTEELTHVAR